MGDEFKGDEDIDLDEDQGVEFDAQEAGLGEGEEQTEAQKAETADLVKLLRQHPEIWIPYEEQVRSQLKIIPAETVDKEGPAVNAGLRDYKDLDAKHTTYPFVTNYERTKIISYRASQIASGAKPYIVVPEGISEAHIIAQMELEEKKLPFLLKRPLPDGTFEVWRLQDLLLFTPS